VSAINTAAFGLGSILGPILASNLEASTGYRWAFSIIGFLALFIGILQTSLSFVGCRKKKRDRIRLVELDDEVPTPYRM
jgi:MFS family permease